jgi:glucan 1,3-beta-glucosidase
LEMLRRVGTSVTRRALAAQPGAASEGPEGQKLRERQVARFQQLGRQESGRPLSQASARGLVQVAELSAIVAASCASKKRSRQDARLEDAVRSQLKLEHCLEVLCQDKVLSASLVRHVGNFCWHSAWAAAWKSQVSSSKTGKAAEEVQLVQLQHRLDAVRAELAADGAQICPLVPPEQKGWKGVNLGGWLLWECGPADSAPIVKAVGKIPLDEWTLSQELREQYGAAEAKRMMAEHRATFITKRDFKEIAAYGMNAVRIPFGYWLVTGPRKGEPFLGPDLKTLDRAFQWAEETGLQVVLSFHGTVGFQSDHQASGRANNAWQPKSWDPNASISVLRKVAERYKNRSSLGGITVVNEPSYDIPLQKLLKYYKDAYQSIRGAGVPERVQVILPVYHREISEFKGHFPKARYKNVVFDVHVYQVFGEDWFNMSLADHLRWASGRTKTHDVKDFAKAGERVIVSEWSLALPVENFRTTIAREWFYLSEAEKNAVLRSFALRQLCCFAAYSEGYFFWSWKDDHSIEWSFQAAGERGLLPVGSPPRPLLPVMRENLLSPPGSTGSSQWQAKSSVGLFSSKTRILQEGAPEITWRNKVKRRGRRLKHRKGA